MVISGDEARTSDTASAGRTNESTDITAHTSSDRAAHRVPVVGRVGVAATHVKVIVITHETHTAVYSAEADAESRSSMESCSDVVDPGNSVLDTEADEV